MEELKIIDPYQDDRWDKFVAEHPLGWIVHTSGWKKVIETTFPHMKGYYFALVDSNTNVIKAGLPIYEIRSWLTGNRLVSIPFATITDPLVSTQQQCDVLTGAATDLLKKLGFSYIEIRSLTSHTLVDKKRFRSNNDYKNHYLDLSIGREAIWKKISYKSIRYLINKAAKNKITMKLGSAEEDIQSFYRLYSSTRKRLGLPAQPYCFFKTLYEIFAHSGNISILLALFDEKVIAGHFLFKFNGRVSVEAAGDDSRYRQLNANQFLYWEGIKSACADGYRIFDFGRTSVYNTTLMDFKRRWGTEQTDFHTFFNDQGKNEIGATSRETSLSYRMIRFMCHNTPGPIQPALSRFCYRHLG